MHHLMLDQIFPVVKGFSTDVTDPLFSLLPSVDQLVLLQVSRASETFQADVARQRLGMDKFVVL